MDNDNYYAAFLDGEASDDESSDYSDYVPPEPGGNSDDLDLDSNDMMDVDDLTRHSSMRFPEVAMVDKVRKVFDVMDGLGINLTVFLDAVSWGNSECIVDARIRSQRTALMGSRALPLILARWWKPPRSKGSKDRRPVGGKATMEEFASKCIQSILNDELVATSAIFRSESGHGYDVSEKELTSIVFKEVISTAKEYAPTLWSILDGLASTPAQQARNKHKNPDKVLCHSWVTIFLLTSFDI